MLRKGRGARFVREGDVPGHRVQAIDHRVQRDDGDREPADGPCAVEQRVDTDLADQQREDRRPDEEGGEPERAAHAVARCAGMRRAAIVVAKAAMISPATASTA